MELTENTSTTVGVDRTSGLQVVLHGEVLGLGTDPATMLAERLARGGLSAPADIRGSFAAIVADPRVDEIAVLTDRLNSRRVFASSNGSRIRLSTRLDKQPTMDSALDPVGIAWFLANGAVHASRTIYARVVVLARASWNTITAEGIKPTSYWEFAPHSDRHAGSDWESRLASELGDAVVESVRNHTSDDPDLFVSLSGGYDATAILGALGADLGRHDFTCFSYALPLMRRDSDECRAAEMSAVVGSPFETILSYNGDLVSVLLDNARLGQGLRGLVYEVDAWNNLAPTFESVENPVVLTGDECFGWRDQALRDSRDVLASVGIQDFGVLRGLDHHLNASVRARMCEGLAEDIEAILARAHQSEMDLHDQRDFIYLDQRLANVILPWREAFARPFATLRNPLLDNDILDLVATMPSQLRRGKALFRRTVSKRYPQLLAIPRAKGSNYMFDLRGELCRHAGAIRDLATSGESGLDDLVPPAVTLALLDRAQAYPDGSRSVKSAIRNVARAALPPLASGTIRRYRPPAPPVAVDDATLVARLLILRSALGPKVAAEAR